MGTVNFKIKENKLDAELIITESEKEKRHCPICQQANRYKNQMAKKKPKKFKAGEIECYPSFKVWYNDLPKEDKEGRKRCYYDNERCRNFFNNNCVGQIEKRKKAEEEER